MVKDDYMTFSKLQAAFKTKIPVYSIILALLSSPVQAGGNKTYGVAARAESMGNAFVAVADDASAVFYNPAGLLQIKETGMIMDVLPIFPYVVYTNGINHESASNQMPGIGLSNFFSKRMGENVAAGVGIYAPFARGTRYRESPALFGYNVKTLFVDLHVAGVVAFKAFDNLSLGLGPILNFDIVNISAFGIKQYALGAGVSGVISALYTVNDRLKLGATWHLPASMNSGGHGKGYFTDGLYFNEEFHLKYKNPGFVDFGLAFQLTHNFLIALGAGLEFWGKANDARFFYDNPKYNNHLFFGSSDTQNYHAGIEYVFKPGKAVRLGYSHHPRSTPGEGLLPGALDFSANVFSVGYGFAYNDKWTVNLGYEYGSSPIVVNGKPIYNPFVGTYNARVNTVMFGLNYQV